MKKIIKKKLVLSRETLRNLREEELNAVPGGATAESCAFSCEPVTRPIRLCQ